MRNLKIKTCTLLLLAAVACTKNQVPSEMSGFVSLSLTTDELVADMTRSNVSDYTSLPAASDFTISIMNSASEPVWSGKISEWDPTTALPSGNYGVTASYGSNETEGFDCPYFSGTQSFAITGGQTTAVKVPVSLRNTVVKIACTQAFKNYFKDYSFKFSRDNADVVSFVKDETRGAFIDGYKITLSGAMKSEVKDFSFSKEYTNLDEATAYTFTFDLTNVGGASLSISFNNTTETVDLGDIELNN